MQGDQIYLQPPDKPPIVICIPSWEAPSPQPAIQSRKEDCGRLEDQRRHEKQRRHEENRAREEQRREDQRARNEEQRREEQRRRDRQRHLERAEQSSRAWASQEALPLPAADGMKDMDIARECDIESLDLDDHEGNEGQSISAWRSHLKAKEKGQSLTTLIDAEDYLTTQLTGSNVAFGTKRRSDHLFLPSKCNASSCFVPFILPVD